MNIEGLTCEKIEEMEYLMLNEFVDVLVLTETHCRGNKFDWSDNIKVLEVQRKLEDKRGGGILVAIKVKEGRFISKVEGENRDIIQVVYRDSGYECHIVGTYWDVVDRERNLMIEKEIGKICRSEENILVVGDFNAHLPEIDGRSNWNGERLRGIIEENGLLNVGISEKCVGKYTWDRNGSKTVIDYVLTDECLFDRVISMKVDEDGVVDIKSGHKYIEVCLNWKKRYERRKNTEDKLVEYYSKSERDLEGFGKKCKEEIEKQDNVNLEVVEGIMVEEAKRMLKRKGRWKGGRRIKKYSNEIGRLIKERRKLNKDRRWEENPERRQEIWEKYLQKKVEIKYLVRKQLDDQERWELDELSRVRDDCLWRKAKKLMGKEKKRVAVKIESNGEVLSETEADKKICSFWEKLYFMEKGVMEEEIVKSRNDDRSMQTDWDQGNEKLREEHGYARARRPWNGRRGIDAVDVELAMKELKKGKAPGLTGLNAEMWLAVYGQVGSRIMAVWLERVLYEGVPGSWLSCKVVLIPKKEGEFESGRVSASEFE